MKEPAAYQKIYRDLLRDIRSGKWGKGEMLPTETALAAQYGVSRITSRHAVSMLAERGYVVRIRGKGSFVAGKQIQQPLIGLIVSDIDCLFGAEFIRGVFHEATVQSYLVIMQTACRFREEKERCLQKLDAAGVQGVIDVPLYDGMRYTEGLRAMSEKMLLVVAGRRVVGLNVPQVCSNNVGGAEFLCEKLRENGYRNVAFISGKTDSVSVTERLKGYFKAFSARQIGEKSAPTIMFSALSGMGGRDNEAHDVSQIERFLRENRHIEAIIASTYRTATLAYRALRRLSQQVPQDCALMCFDVPRTNGESGQFAYMKQDEYEIGATAVRCLIDRIEGRPVPDIIYVDSLFVDGKSYIASGQANM